MPVLHGLGHLGEAQASVFRYVDDVTIFLPYCFYIKVITRERQL